MDGEVVDILAAPTTGGGFVADNWIWMALIAVLVIGGIVGFILLRAKSKRAEEEAGPTKVKAKGLLIWALLSFVSLGMVGAVIALLYMEQKYYIGDPTSPNTADHENVWPAKSLFKSY